MSFKMNSRLYNFIEKYKLPGWYIDVRNCYCCIVNNYLISIFYDCDDDTLNVTVDGIDSCGYYYMNYEWESFDDEKEILQMACEFVKEYSKK